MKLRKLAGVISPQWREPMICEACKEPFVCGASLTGCWCCGIKLGAQIRAELRAQYRRCLCRRCLERFARQETDPGSGAAGAASSSNLAAMQSNRRRGALALIALVGAALVMIALGIEAARRLTGAPMSPDAAVNRTEGARSRFPRYLRDASGATLIIPSPPQRIASQTLGTDEILLAICSPDRIVALSSLATDPNYSNVVEQARAAQKPAVQGAEQVLKLNPDLIFVASYSRAEVVDLLRAAGAPVFRFANFDRIEDIKANIRTVGYAIGDEARAEALVAQMERELEAIRARALSVGKRPRVMSYGALGYTAGANTLFDDMARIVGAINISAEQGINRFQKISAEQITMWQPDFIVTGANAGTFDAARRRLLADPAIASSSAGRAGRIIVIDNRYYLTVSHHVVGAVEALAEGLYKP